MNDAETDALLAKQPNTSRRVALRHLARHDQNEFLDLVSASMELHRR